jgi:hypothetical protein
VTGLGGRGRRVGRFLLQVIGSSTHRAVAAATPENFRLRFVGPPTDADNEISTQASHNLPQRALPGGHSVGRDNKKTSGEVMFLLALCRKLAGMLANQYRPERHYMRGPGPKWREKHSD